jgi:hypothetical protein
MADFRALCKELMDAIDSGVPVERIKQSPLAVRVDATLAQPEPQGPTDLLDETLLNEADAYFLYGEGKYTASLEEVVAFARRMFLAGQSWGRPAIEPVPVSEGMPGPEDVNDDGEVWVEEPAYDYPLGDTGDYDSEPGRWVLRPLSSLDKRFKRRWLPHWALPVPGVEGADG